MEAPVTFVERNLRYRTLEAVTGCSITINGFESFMDDIVRDSREGLPADVSPYGPPLELYVPAQMAKYGLADPLLVTKQIQLHDKDAGGIPLLQELGFLPSSYEPGQDLGHEEDFLKDLAEELLQGTTFVRLFLLSEAPDRSRGLDVLMLPEHYFPREFKVADACLSNASLVWFHKHFYM